MSKKLHAKLPRLKLRPERLATNRVTSSQATLTSVKWSPNLRWSRPNFFLRKLGTQQLHRSSPLALKHCGVVRRHPVRWNSSPSRKHLQAVSLQEKHMHQERIVKQYPQKKYNARSPPRYLLSMCAFEECMLMSILKNPDRMDGNTLVF